MTETPNPATGSVPDTGTQSYDAFLSYSSADRRLVKRVQVFLERYRFGTPKRRVRVYLDQTDIRGGDLGGEIGKAIEAARVLVVCYSPAAADSHWVRREIGYATARSGKPKIALLELGGDADATPLPALEGQEYRRHDIRGGWWFRWLKPRARLELLRLLAYVTDVDLRVLRNWHLRRQLRMAALSATCVVLLFWLVFSVPVGDWVALDLKSGTNALYAIAAEADGSKLQLASRFRGPGPQGFRNYIRITENALDPSSKFDLSQRYAFRGRLLPVNQLPFPLGSHLPAYDLKSVTDRQPAVNLPVFAGEPRPGLVVSVRALGPTEEEKEEFESAAADFSFALPVPTTLGSIVAVGTGSEVHAVEIPDLSLVWQERAPSGEPTSPARGLSIACGPDDTLWLGVQGWDGVGTGGLWFSPDSGRSWNRLPGFINVVSVAVRGRGAGQTITAAEGHIDLWRGSFLEPSPARVVFRVGQAGPWRPAPMPPFGTRSEVEFCGMLGNSELVRVDEKVLRSQKLPLWRFLWNRAK